MRHITQRQLGKKIQLLREQAGMTQEELAEYMGLTRQAVGQMEKGDRKVDSLELLRLTSCFDVPLDYLLWMEGSSSSVGRAPQTSVKFVPDKLRNLLLYILQKCGGKPNVGETVLYKLLYFIDFDAFEILGTPVTGIPYLKMQFGPVPRKVDYDSVIKKMMDQDELKVFSHQFYDKIQKRYVALTEPDLVKFSADEINLVDKIINRMSDMSATEISNYVHSDAPWKATSNMEIIDYGLVHDREEPHAQRDSFSIWEASSMGDILAELGPMSEEETEYYNKL